MASAATPTPAGTDDQVVAAVGVSLGALRDTSVLCCRALTAQDVLAVGDGLHVIQTDTSTMETLHPTRTSQVLVVAEVVDLEPLRHRSVVSLEDDSMH